MLKTFILLSCLLYCINLNAQPLNPSTIAPQEGEIQSPVFKGEDIDSLKLLIGAQVDQKVRLRACKLLAEAITKRESIETTLIDDLLQYYSNEYDLEVRYETLACFGKIYPKKKDKRIADLFVNIIKTKNLNVYFKTRAILICTCFAEDYRVKNELLEIIKRDPLIVNTENTEWLKASAVTLGKMKCKEAIPVFLNKMLHLLRDTENNLFREYISFGPDDFSQRTMGDYLIGIYASGLNIMGGEEVINAVIPLLDDENKKVRYQGAKILGGLGNAKAVPLLCEMLVDSDDYQDRFAAIYILDKFEDKSTIPFLEIALKDKYREPMTGSYIIRYKAYKTLQKLGVKVSRGKRDTYKVEE